MDIVQRAKAVQMVDTDKNDRFYIRKVDGTLEHINILDEMKAMARRVEILSGAIKSCDKADPFEAHEALDLIEEALKKASEV